MGGKAGDMPDYEPLAKAARESTDKMSALGQRQMDFAERQYAEQAPIARQVAAQQMAAQNQQMAQAQDYYDYQKNTYRPVEQGLVADARNFSTQDYREQLARDAAAAAGKAFGINEAATSRAAGARGINPNSGAGLGLQMQNNLGLSAMRSNAMTGARTQAEQMGWARRMDVTGLGRNLAGASTAAYQGASGAGTSGINTSMAAGNQFGQLYGQGVGTVGSGYQMGNAALGNVLSNQTSRYSAGLQAEGEMYGAALGAGATYAKSDRRLKDDIKLVGVDERTGLNLYEFTYKDGSGQKYIGVMADEVKVNFPEAVFTMPDGFDAVNYEKLGIEFKKV
jgi:hypothetical protein